MDKLASANALIVSQQKEWGEILTDFETRNKYFVLDESGERLYRAAEEAGSALARLFLKAYRPFKIVVLSEAGPPVWTITRPFRFYFHEAEIAGSNGERLGAIKRQFSLVRRIYTVEDSAGMEVCQLFGPLLHPWTFNIQVRGIESGKITKKWSGLMKEGFTDADNFGVQFPPEFDPRLRCLILGAVFLIDFVHFEDTGG